MAIFSKKEDSSNDAGNAVKASTVKVPAILVQPRISEKSGHLASLNKYVFKVKLSANKVEVKKAVENAYKVKVLQVNIVRNQGKKRNFGRMAGRTSAFKKAIVTLKSGEKIEGLTEII